MIKKDFFCVAVLLLAVYCSQAQDGRTVPSGLDPKIFRTIAAVDMPEADAAIRRIKSEENSYLKASLVAHNFKTAFSPGKSGHWSIQDGNANVWFLKIRSRGAVAMAVVLSKVKLNPGERLYVYNLNGVSGFFTHRDVPASGVLPLGYVKGDEIMIEYQVNSNDSAPGTFVVESVSHAFRDTFFASGGDGCNVDVQCPEGVYWENARRSVVRLTVHTDNGTRICTGSLVNNTALDKKPYILTAEHCVTDQTGADRTVITFNYENTYCHGNEGSHAVDLHGAYLRASLYENDFALLQAYDLPPLAAHPYYAGWDIADQHRDHVACIHHPGGGPKKVSLFSGVITTSSFEDDTHAKNAFWNIWKWDTGVTESGSSGAPLFNKNHDVIGSLTGGSSACGSPYNDYFQKLSVSWEASTEGDKQLKTWLDPLSSDVQRLGGLDPFEGIDPVCDTLYNVRPDETLALANYVPLDPQSGYISGVNSDSIAMYAEQFFSPDSVMITGVRLEIGSINPEADGGLFVSVHKNDDGLPGETIYETYVPYNDLDAFNDHISFYPYVSVIGTFFISYTISYSDDDTFAVQHASPRENGADNTAFIKADDGWKEMNEVMAQGYGTSLAIRALICRNQPEELTESEKLILYPNPAPTVVVVQLPKDVAGELSLEVVDVQGKLQPVYQQYVGRSVVLDVTKLNPGIYIVRLSNAGKNYQSRFIRTRF